MPMLEFSMFGSATGSLQTACADRQMLMEDDAPLYLYLSRNKENENSRGAEGDLRVPPPKRQAFRSAPPPNRITRYYISDLQLQISGSSNIRESRPAIEASTTCQNGIRIFQASSSAHISSMEQVNPPQHAICALK